MVQFFLCFGKVLSTMCLLVPCLKILDVGRCGDDGRDEIQKKSVESGLDIMSRVESRAGFCVVHVDIVWRRFRRVTCGEINLFIITESGMAIQLARALLSCRNAQCDYNLQLLYLCP
jgi:hypothetical protein